MRQHLTAVRAAAAVSGAEIDGASLGSTWLSFQPGFVKGGDCRFSIGTAGSCTLVLQTILPALLRAKQDSHIVLNGGTHNAMSPPFHFLQRAFLSLLMRMDAKVEFRLNRFGFYPAGGGEITMHVKAGSTLLPLHLESRGKQVNAYAESFYAGLPAHIAERELALVKQHMMWHDDQLFMCELDRNQGPGNALLITLSYEQLTEVFAGFGEKGVPAETVANRAVNAARNYLASDATVDHYLADQLLLPLALAGVGSFIATEWSRHGNPCRYHSAFLTD